MGGILILAAIIVSSLLWCSLSNLFVWLCLAVILVFGATGFADDYVKVKKHTPDAMTAKMKLLLQFVTAFARGLAGYRQHFGKSAFQPGGSLC